MRRYARRTARVIVVDPLDRVLLMRFELLSGPGFAWFTPGGGVKPWERLAGTAARELREEIGLVVAARRLRRIAYASGYADLGFVKGRLRDDFFLHRVSEEHAVDTRRHTAIEKRSYAGSRWWSAEELRQTEETVYPFRLGELLADLVAGRAPTDPVELPWHL